jgi:hypothetical protein
MMRYPDETEKDQNEAMKINRLLFEPCITFLTALSRIS